MTRETMSETMEDEEVRWYIVHSYSGQEERAKKNLELRIGSMDMMEQIFQVVVPTEEQVEIREGRRVPRKVKSYPGYILVQMKMTDKSWHAVRNTPGITGFISAEIAKDKRPRPVPLEESEVRKILNQMEADTPRIKIGYAPGQNIRIIDGPFIDFIGTVTDVYEEKGKIQILVSFFGRETPVELDFLQVERI